ncbi:MAG: hypothetical protein M1834_000504 [Cirrosporium novae-zelandiae]|nr:MAG: hypothetical protein M1834_000504 [Cirrosporium novae-zelandiae]
MASAFRPLRVLSSPLLKTPSPFFSLQRAYTRGTIDPRKIAVSGQTPHKSNPKNERPPQNNDITATHIHLVDSVGNLLPPQTRWDVMRSVDTKTHVLMQVSAEGPDGYPVCKIRSKNEIREKQWAMTKAAKAVKRHTKSLKQLELNYALDLNDLGHKLNRLETFLNQGRRVEILLASKKKGRTASVEEASLVVKKIKERAEGTGATEVEPMTGEIPGLVKLVFQGVDQIKSSAS